MSNDPLGYDESPEEGSGFAHFLLLLFAGACALAAFDAFGQIYAPDAGYPKLAPVPLATQSLVALFGEEYRQFGEITHYLMGILGYPLGYLAIARPIARAVIPGIPWWILGVAFGVVIWAFALYVMAHLVAGNPPFLGFGALAWVALAGHVVYGLVLAAVARSGLRA